MKRLSKHIKTGEQMPDEMIETKYASKRNGQALEDLKKMQKAVFDFAIHSEAEQSEPAYQDGIIAQARRHIKHKDGG